MTYHSRIIRRHTFERGLYKTFMKAVMVAEATRDATIAASELQHQSDKFKISEAHKRIPGGNYVSLKTAVDAVLETGIDVSWVNIWQV